MRTTQGTIDGRRSRSRSSPTSGSFGAMSVVRAAGEEPFSPSEVGLMKTLAAQTALAIERAALDGEVREARLQVEANALRAALFSSVTHDLRTPLSSIKASASGLLAEGAHYSDEERRDVLRTVVEEADHLNLIVGNLLDLARMRAGALVPSKQPVLIDEVIGSVLQRMRRSLEDVVVRTTIRPELPPVEADPVQIGQVLTNLIENAIRFSPRGARSTSPPRAGARRSRCGSLIRVPGSREADRDRVFEEFYRQDAGGGPWRDRSRTRDRASGGDRARRHDLGGSAPGGGTAIDLRAADRTNGPHDEASPLLGASERRVVTRVLVIDDEPQILRALRRSLEAQDYEVATAEGGEEGLAWRPHRPRTWSCWTSDCRTSTARR